MVYACLGMGLMSFWLSFVIADRASVKRKAIWCVTGVSAIWFINCCRVALLLMAFENNWKVNEYANHHTIFNIVAYALLLILIYFYMKSGKKIIEKRHFNNPVLTQGS